MQFSLTPGELKDRERNIMYNQDKMKELMSQMTLEEKLAQIGAYWVYQINEGIHLSREKAERYLSNGIGQITRVNGASSMKPKEAAAFNNEVQDYMRHHTRLGIPALIHEEACSGFTAIGATTFPQAIGLASAFEPELLEEISKVIGRQMRAVGAHQALAPLLDITRDPRWGRTEETFGEDPYLVSQMGMHYVRGLQGKLDQNGVIATGKHFVGYGAPEGGMNWAPAHIPERELYEVYLAPFEAAVKQEKLGSIMNGYHELDGIPCGASKKLLTDVLKKKWGFDGIVVSDYFAINQLFDYHNMADNKKEAAKLAIEAGMEVELPNVDCFGEPLKEAVEAGEVSMELIDSCVEKMLRFKMRLGLFDNPYVDVQAVESCFDTKEDRSLARRAAGKTIVLLKNKNHILPLNRNLESIAVIGPCADSIRNLVGDYTYQGQIEGLLELYESQNTAMNQPIPENIKMEENIVAMDSLLTAVRNTVSDKTKVFYAKGCDIKEPSTEGFAEAIQIARESKAAIVCVGDLAGITLKCTVGESVDRAELTLPGVQEALIQEISGTGTPTIVVLTNGRPYAINREAEHADAILEAWFPGEEGANAVADTLFGLSTPGGKLPITFPRSAGQIPTYYMHKKSGGRTHWRGDYDDLPAKPLYPFGFGLSYTEFTFEEIVVDKKKVEIGNSFCIGVTIKNIGNYDGDEVIQLYTHDTAASVTRPVKELKGFKRVSLKPGESKRITFNVETAQLGFYGRDINYIVEPGEIEVMLGVSSMDIFYQNRVILTGECQGMENEKVFSTKITVE